MSDELGCVAKPSVDETENLYLFRRVYSTPVCSDHHHPDNSTPLHYWIIFQASVTSGIVLFIECGYLLVLGWTEIIQAENRLLWVGSGIIGIHATLEYFQTTLLLVHSSVWIGRYPFYSVILKFTWVWENLLQYKKHFLMLKNFRITYKCDVLLYLFCCLICGPILCP